MSPLFTPANGYAAVEEAMVLFPSVTRAPGSFWTTWGKGCTSALIPMDGAIEGRPPRKEKPRQDRHRKEGENMTHAHRPVCLESVGGLRAMRELRSL